MGRRLPNTTGNSLIGVGFDHEPPACCPHSCPTPLVVFRGLPWSARHLLYQSIGLTLAASAAISSILLRIRGSRAHYASEIRSKSYCRASVNGNRKIPTLIGATAIAPGALLIGISFTSTCGG